MARLENSVLAKGLTRIEVQGTILALTLNTKSQGGYADPVRAKVAPFFAEKGILLRPLGSVLYVLPPVCIEDVDLELIYTQLELFIEGLSYEKKPNS